MRRLLLIVMCCLVALAALAGGEKRVSHRYHDVSMAEALLQLGKECKGRYVINFMYDELEDFSITTTVKKLTVPEAIRQMIGHYPMIMTIERDSAIYVECIKKAPARFKGVVVDEQGQPLEYANVTLLSPRDSTALGGGVTTASGRFVIPYDPQPVVARVTYVGYRPARRRCEGTDAGTIRMELDNVALAGVTVSGNKAERPKKHKRDRRQREHVLITLNDSTVVDGFLVSDIQGDKVRIYRNGLNPRVIHLRDIKSLRFVNEGDTAMVEYIPVTVIDDQGDDKRAKLRLLTRVYDSDYLVGYTSPATDYYTYETQTYSGPTSTNPAGSWHTHVHAVPFATRQYYYQVKGNAIATPYWLQSWSPSKSSMRYHVKKIFRHFPSLIATVNGPDFDSKTFFEHPETLLPVLDQALQQGDYQAVTVTQDNRADRTEVLRKIFDSVDMAAMAAAWLFVLLQL